MPLPKLTVASLKRFATEASYSRGDSYFRAGAVTAVTLRQQTLHGQVEGNDIDPYRVTVTFDGGGVTDARCSCPYSFEGWCKHIVATLLVCVHQPKTVVERPPLASLLAQLNPSQTRDLIQSLVTREPALLESVDFYVSSLAQPVAAAETQGKRAKRKTSVDPAPYKQRVQEILREAVRGWEYGQDDDSIAFDIDGLLEDAIAFLERGDGDNALVLLQGITEGCVQYWYIVDDFIGMGADEFGIDFDSAWAEALLSTDLSAEDVVDWQVELEGWQDSLGGFDMALEALRQGWDYLPLQRALNGESTAQGAWDGEAPEWADEFSLIRLAILKRQERYEDYLNLAQAEGQTQAYLTMLGQLGRVDEAMSVAKEEMTMLAEAKPLAETLRAQERLPEALAIALRGLQLEPLSDQLTFEFASWTRDLAEGLEDPKAALEASIVAFKAKPSLKDFKAIEELSKKLSNERWEDIKQQLLQQIRRLDIWHEATAQIDILLHENLLDDAVKKVSGVSHYHDRLTLRVMDAATSSHSQWVMESAVANAEAIMDSGKAKYYDVAVEWLRRAKAAYVALNQEQDWLHYRRQLAETHGRKRKLMGLLVQNRL
ncbi:MAG: SWIM zinc finger family protein [Cyanobacteria bacterium J06635_11]